MTTSASFRIPRPPHTSSFGSFHAGFGIFKHHTARGRNTQCPCCLVKHLRVQFDQPDLVTINDGIQQVKNSQAFQNQTGVFAGRAQCNFNLAVSSLLISIDPWLEDNTVNTLEICCGFLGLALEREVLQETLSHIREY